MAEGAENARWNHTASLAATLINVHGTRRRGVDPARLHPLRQRRRKKHDLPRVGVEVLIHALVKNPPAKVKKV